MEGHFFLNILLPSSLIIRASHDRGFSRIGYPGPILGIGARTSPGLFIVISFVSADAEGCSLTLLSRLCIRLSSRRSTTKLEEIL